MIQVAIVYALALNMAEAVLFDCVVCDREVRLCNEALLTDENIVLSTLVHQSRSVVCWLSVRPVSSDELSIGDLPPTSGTRWEADDNRTVTPMEFNDFPHPEVTR